MNKTAHQIPGIPSQLYRPLSDSAVQTIAEDAFRLLEKGGMLVYSKTAREAFERAGAEVDHDAQKVKLPRSLVEDAIASNPSSVTLHARNDDFDAVLEGSRVHYGTGGTAIYVLDPDTGERRPSTVADVALNARMVETLDNIHLFTINVFPNDVKEKDEVDVNRFFHALDNTTKHIMGGIYSMAGCRKVVAMAESLAGGEDALRARPFLSFITLIISPFKVDDHYGEMTCYLARKGLPVVVPTEPICGTTSPITLAANVLTHVAETLGGIALVQCVNKGAPGICGSVGSITNLRTMDHVAGGIERAMINAAVSQMAQHFRLPYYSTGGTTDSKAVDVQSSYESAMSSLLVAMSGANYIHDIAGLMEADLTVSYEKLVVDNEILGMCQRVLRGIEVNEETLATDMMIQKGPGGHYIAEEHTVNHMIDEFYMPQLSDRTKRRPEEPPSQAYQKAAEYVASIRAAQATSCLTEEQRDALCKMFPEIRTLTPA